MLSNNTILKIVSEMDILETAVYGNIKREDGKIVNSGKKKWNDFIFNFSITNFLINLNTYNIYLLYFIIILIINIY